MTPMRNLPRLLLVCALLLTMRPVIAFAQPDSRVAQANAGVVGVISGGVAGTYVRIAADLAAVLDDGNSLRVLPVIGKGSIQNLSDILFLKGIDIGIVQSDALAYVLRQHLFPGAGASIQYIAKLYEEEVHLLARQDIHSVQDLAGKVVNADVPGSGTAMTAQLLFADLGVQPVFAHDDQETALAKLKAGEIAAVTYVVGKPAALFTTLRAESGLHFLSVPLTPALAETYLPTRLGAAEYPGLVGADAPVETVAVSAVMACFAWPASSDRYRPLAHFVERFFTRFPLFLKPGRHPKWKEVNLAARVPGWTRFAAAEAELANTRH
jgi:TRAP transporter TAXI family solute receptor